MAKPLYQAARKSPTSSLTCLDTIHHHFSLLWDILLMAPTLGFLDHTWPYHLFTNEKVGVTSQVLAQLVEPSNQAAVFLSKHLDPTICWWHPSLRALTAASKLTQEVHKNTLSESVPVHSTHYLSDLLSYSCGSPAWALMGEGLSFTISRKTKNYLDLQHFTKSSNPHPCPFLFWYPSNFCSEAVET